MGADNLHTVWFATEETRWGAVSYPDFLDLIELSDTRFSITGVGWSSFLATVRRDQSTSVSRGEAVAGGFFSVLGIEMSAGRGFSAEEDRPGADPVTVISHDYWASQYAADPDVPGRTILLNNEPYTIVGVAGPEFRGSSSGFRPQFWLPLEQFLRVYRAPDTRVNRETGSVLPLVRLAEGAWIDPDARAEEASTTRIMMAAAGFLLLLACANVANLVLSAGARRHSEMALRGALGATRGRLVRQLLTENLLLSVPACVAALAMAGPLSGRLSSYFDRPSVWGTYVPREIVVDPNVMFFAFLVAVATGVATGLVPALRVSAHNPAEALGTRGGGSFAGRRPRVWLPGTR